MYHLFVDDVAHYGEIKLKCSEEFNPDSPGYTYIRGKSLIAPLIELHHLIARDISREDAAYRSHLIIEMIYDLVIREQIDKNQSMQLLEDAIGLHSKRSDVLLRHDILYGIEKPGSLCTRKCRDLYDPGKNGRLMNLKAGFVFLQRNSVSETTVCNLLI